MPSTELSTFVKYSVGDLASIFQTYSGSNSTWDKFDYDPSFVAPALVQLQIPFYEVTSARLIMIQTSLPIDLMLDDINNSTIRVNDILYLTTEASSLYASNFNNVDVTLKVVILGI
jgi:hypothetical protein